MSTPSAAQQLRELPADLLHNLVIPLLANPHDHSAAAMRQWEERFMTWLAANQDKTSVQVLAPLPMPPQWGDDLGTQKVSAQFDATVVHLFMLAQEEMPSYAVWEWLVHTADESRAHCMLHYVWCKDDWATIRDPEKHRVAVEDEAYRRATADAADSD